MSLFFAILGALGLFLYGMKVMSEGLQKVAGESLRALVRNMSGKRISGIISGTLVTALVQSSSATTVMIVSFVNARLLTLTESIGMIMGANLGTTITFWIVALLGFTFNLTSIALPCVGIGVAMLFFKRAKLRDCGEALIGFGILFLGLSLLKQTVPDIRSDPERFSFLADWSGMGIGSVAIFFVFGIILTLMVQSSSVAGAITLTLAAKGWIGYEDAAAIVLGENVGTTITANCAAMTAGTEAKRAARAHLMFNIIGVLWMIPVFDWFVDMVDQLVPRDSNNKEYTLYHLALFHSMFNLTNICVQVPFVQALAKLATKMVRDKGGTELEREPIHYQAPNLPQTGEINLAEAEREIRAMAELTRQMFRGFKEVYKNPDKNLPGRVKELKAMEARNDRLAFDITQHLIDCTSSELSRKHLNEVTIMLRVVAELEEICDCAYNLVRLAEQKYNKQRGMPEATQQAIADFCGPVDQFMNFYIESLSRKVTMTDIELAQQLEGTIDAARQKLRHEAVRRMSDPANVESEMLYIDILNHIEGIGDHSLNILKLLSHID
jgi:phosphate:Na+ symporter